jgi:hypothetical protein
MEDRMKAIMTKYFGATNFRGSRIKAYDNSGNSVTVPYDYEAAEDEDVHRKAAEALRDKMGWTGELAGGATDKGYAFVFVK